MHVRPCYRFQIGGGVSFFFSFFFSEHSRNFLQMSMSCICALPPHPPTTTAENGDPSSKAVFFFFYSDSCATTKEIRKRTPILQCRSGHMQASPPGSRGGKKKRPSHCPFSFLLPLPLLYRPIIQVSSPPRTAALPKAQSCQLALNGHG